MKIRLAELSQKKLFYPIIFFVFLAISFLPPITQEPYSPEDTQQVIIELLMVAIKPYQAFGIIFHIATIILVGWILVDSTASGRPLTIFMGVNFIIIALVQSFGTTEMYGDVVHTGGLVAFILLGILWIWAGVTGGTEPLLANIQWHHMFFSTFCGLIFLGTVPGQGKCGFTRFQPSFTSYISGLWANFLFYRSRFLILIIHLISKDQHTCVPHHRVQCFVVRVV